MLVLLGGCVNSVQVSDFAFTEIARLPSALAGQILLLLSQAVIPIIQFVPQ